MSYGGDTAEMMVKEGIEITEAAVKLAALGMKNLAALVLALAKDEHKVAGLTNIGRMLKDDNRLKVFDLKSDDIGRFTQEAKSYGVLFTIIDNPGSGMADVVVRESDVQRVCRIFERIGYSVPQEGKEDTKNANARAPHEKKSEERGTGLKASAHRATTTEEKPPAAPHRKSSAPDKAAAPKMTAIRDDIAPKPSVVSRVEAIKRAKAALDKENAAIIKSPAKVQTGPVK